VPAVRRCITCLINQARALREKTGKGLNRRTRAKTSQTRGHVVGAMLELPMLKKDSHTQKERVMNRNAGNCKKVKRWKYITEPNNHLEIYSWINSTPNIQFYQY